MLGTDRRQGPDRVAEDGGDVAGSIPVVPALVGSDREDPRFRREKRDQRGEGGDVTRQGSGRSKSAVEEPRRGRVRERLDLVRVPGPRVTVVDRLAVELARDR